MGTSALLSLGMKAMFANQAALQTIGQNIANANTPGYSRQLVNLTTPEGQFTGAGYFGKGVTVQTVTRAHNEFLTKEAASSKSLAFMDSTKFALLQQLEKIFPTGNAGLGQAANQFLNSMVDVASRPADPSARQVALGRAQELAARFSDAGAQLADLQAGVVSDLKADLGVVNQLAKQIAAANDQIARANGTGHTPNDLLDQREQLISQLSQYVQVTTLPADDGTVGVFIGGGQRLVLGDQAQTLSVTPDPYDSSRAQVSISEANGARALDESVLTGGSISALLAYQNKDLQDARNLLGQMAMSLSMKVNGQQALGLDLSNPPGVGAPIFGVGDPRALPNSSNVRNPDGSYATTMAVQIVDPSRVPANSFVLRTDPSGTPGQYELTARPDGKPEVLSAAQIEQRYGLRLTEGGSPMTPSDSFALEPVAMAAIGMKRILDNTNGLAAASPITGVTNINNTGTMTVDSLYAVNSNLDMSKVPMSIQFGAVNPADNSVAYSITMSDGSVVNGNWKAGSVIGNEPLAGIDLGFELRLNGVPKPGDTLDINATQFPAANNSNAKAFLNLQTESFVGRVLQADGSLSKGATITDAYASAMSEIGARVQGAKYLAGVSTSVASDAEKVRSGQAGVNLDEEAARLMQYQQGYQAAAKVLQAGQKIFDELLQLAQR
ncbi:flagellar hook-associated protein FlgK [Roseateles sp. DAIF2]|uniref:flagellar hook-associated protein FlgK n=1 Tax=Roseateles sp. DAIF2 TaxID=2714952 RepID=UPI0018A3020D|nr:flagellar hook-associated protein FlgK [Roseateles sp. DAIF2]QPF73146.1 flagellar hook-associated protein FlgK [Roseateles sp. DAIF2]